ncbi:MAG: glycoside hydrolase family 2 TIM barrel-domain containing protein [Candidatus Omnitrophica bacterium]|nr:glycoside hydrolase family 2 TIM barrel-domain containing protein [Candidatus Omnitrophota bacterium]MDD5352987.1 glycoside hydrolase family 2 TIM barrel-domain containing protein [Candidatus Omnitrophota bacterium]MDD5550586.1 glycoside hydrolase family 2 TIM barrel-domain containing protein [Candidatus Omnitrophota bacterium]
MKRAITILFLGIVFLGYTAFSQPSATKVGIRKLKNGHYQLLVNKKPYIIKGVCYNPIPIGATHDYDFWGDASEPWKLDGKLMKDMGVNTVRFYQPGQNPASVKKVMNDLYKLYGIRTIMGHWLGFWNYPMPFYADAEFRDNVKKDVLAMVREYKDEPGILFWVLGNENNYSFSGRVNAWSSAEIDALCEPSAQINERARIYYSFVNELAREIHAIDPNHPVAMGNGELMTLDIANKVCPDVDIVACIIYRGKTFGNIFKSLRNVFDRPLVFIEFGCDAYNAYTKQEDQDSQAEFLESQWVHIYQNLAKNPEGVGNCLGGTTFEWTDEWWKHKEYAPQGWSVHDTESNWSNGAYYFDIKVPGNKNMNEEWFGLVALSNELENGLNKRMPRKSYYSLREFWKNPNRKLNEKNDKPKK